MWQLEPSPQYDLLNRAMLTHYTSGAITSAFVHAWVTSGDLVAHWLASLLVTREVVSSTLSHCAPVAQ